MGVPTGTLNHPTVVRRNLGPDPDSPEVYILRFEYIFATEMEIAFYLRGSGNSLAIFADVPLSTDAWHHFAATFDGVLMQMFWDGQVVATGPNTGPIFPTTHPLRIGTGGVFEPWLGLLDDVRLWNVARTQAQIQSFMNTPLLGTEAGLVGDWRFDDGSGQLATDATANGNTGQLGSTPLGDPNDPLWTPSSAPVGVEVLSLTPSHGPFYASTPVTIVGQGFASAPLSLAVGGLPVTTFTVVSPTTITAVFPPGSVGPADVTVSTPYGTGTLSGGWEWADHFHSDSTEISVSAGGSVELSLFASPANALRLYLVASSASGTSPGTPLPSFPSVLPLNVDPWLEFALLNVNTPLFEDFFGALDFQGEGTAVFDPGPPPISPAVVGLGIHFSYVVLQLAPPAITLVSNPVPVSFVP